MKKLSILLYTVACLAFGFIATAIKGELTTNFGYFLISYLATVIVFTVIGFSLGFTRLHPLFIIFISILLEYSLSRMLGDKLLNQTLSLSANIQWGFIFGPYAGAAIGWFIYDYLRNTKPTTGNNRRSNDK